VFPKVISLLASYLLGDAIGVDIAPCCNDRTSSTAIGAILSEVAALSRLTVLLPALIVEDASALKSAY